MDTDPRDLDDPEYAAFAWGRYRRILRWMTAVSLLVSAGALLVLWLWLGELRIHVAIAAGFGIFATMMLAAALMGLMFLSSGSGHDERVEDPLRGEIEIGD